MQEKNKTLIIRPSRLEGTIRLSGAKNSALRLLVASVLTKETIEINNFPSKLSDGLIQIEMLKKIGKDCKLKNDRVIISEKTSLDSKVIWNGRSIRNTLLLLGALVARTGQGAVPLPGGCKLGDRKYDLHKMLLNKLGADVWTENDMLCAEAPSGLNGTEIHLPIRSTGATENAIFCGCLAKGTTRIWNPHIRPEIIDLIDMLCSMGAKIEIFGQEHICIKGVEILTGTSYSVIMDNVEALTWLIGSVITNGDVEIIDFPFEHLEVPLIHLRESGAKFYKGNNRIIVRGGHCYPIDISTGPYPGINSDMQPLFAVYGILANGESRIIDLRFPGRYQYAEELSKMGAVFQNDGNLLKIKGGRKLKGTKVLATDLRAGVALAFAGLIAEGETIIKDAWQIDRGYNDFETKLKNLNGSCEYV